MPISLVASDMICCLKITKFSRLFLIASICILSTLSLNRQQADNRQCNVINIKPTPELSLYSRVIFLEVISIGVYTRDIVLFCMIFQFCRIRRPIHYAQIAANRHSCPTNPINSIHFCQVLSSLSGCLIYAKRKNPEASHPTPKQIVRAGSFLPTIHQTAILDFLNE